MLRYLVRRVPSTVLVLLLASIAIFAIIRLIPGDPATSLAGSDATPEAVAAIRHDLGLDRSVPVQYLHWIGDVLTLDLGTSYSLGGQITSLVADGFANTLVLTVTALLLAILIAAIVGPLWATTRNRWLESAITVTNTLAVALPTFVTGVLLVLLLAVVFPVLPSSGVPPDGMFARLDITAQYLLMPALCLALPVAAVLSRFLAETLRTELRQPYVLTATALGVPRRRLLLRYALRNALPTALTVIGLQTGALLGGAVLVEGIFAWPGIGQLVEQAVGRRDYPLVQILLLLSVFIFVIIQLVTDILHALLDPRVRIGGAS